MEVTSVSTNKWMFVIISRDWCMWLLMKSFPKLFKLIQGMCHIGSATVPLIIRPVHQNKPQHPFSFSFIVSWSVFIASLLSYFAINHIIPQRAGHKIKYALSEWIQKRTFKAGLALATLVSEGGRGYLNSSFISIMRTTLDRDDFWYPSLSFKWKWMNKVDMMW